MPGLNMKEFQDCIKSAYNVALRRLGLSAMTKKQIEMYLLKKGYTHNVVDQVINKLSTELYIDDALFAANVVRKTLEREPKSKMMLSHELRLKGINEELISGAMQLFDVELEQEMANCLAHMYFKKYKLADSETMKNKISQALYRKGFQWSVINKALKNVNSDD